MLTWLGPPSNPRLANKPARAHFGTTTPKSRRQSKGISFVNDNAWTKRQAVRQWCRGYVTYLPTLFIFIHLYFHAQDKTAPNTLSLLLPTTAFVLDGTYRRHWYFIFRWRCCTSMHRQPPQDVLAAAAHTPSIRQWLSFFPLTGRHCNTEPLHIPRNITDLLLLSTTRASKFTVKVPK